MPSSWWNPLATRQALSLFREPSAWIFVRKTHLLPTAFMSGVRGTREKVLGSLQFPISSPIAAFQPECLRASVTVLGSGWGTLWERRVYLGFGLIILTFEHVTIGCDWVVISGSVLCWEQGELTPIGFGVEPAVRSEHSCSLSVDPWDVYWGRGGVIYDIEGTGNTDGGEECWLVEWCGRKVCCQVWRRGVVAGVAEMNIDQRRDRPFHQIEHDEWCTLYWWVGISNGILWTCCYIQGKLIAETEGRTCWKHSFGAWGNRHSQRTLRKSILVFDWWTSDMVLSCEDERWMEGNYIES